jgi:hypothetical protein
LIRSINKCDPIILLLLKGIQFRNLEELMIIATISCYPPSLELLLLLTRRGIRVLGLPASERLPVVLVDIIRYHLLPLSLPDVYEVIAILRAI